MECVIAVGASFLEGTKGFFFGMQRSAKVVLNWGYQNFFWDTKNFFFRYRGFFGDTKKLFLGYEKLFLLYFSGDSRTIAPLPC